ncbi:SRPBCC family protein [Kitasatospora sp. A2-31]|uniref:SRPBCC family protein n=1 Tax=Kitasatospora sp. A2-31 TaxID=2916414 RepID=UPI001EECCD5D|nr:SRPBCC family protein [Kitasatospora sp. A2-31]MCG6494582.1 SRPBCC family protein [Kitasatospora sp. A2-31]
MEHEVVVPMPAEQVRQALQDPALLARCVPGLSTEPAAAGSGPAEEIGGRLKLRIGASTITYRGVLSLIEGREGVLTVFAEGQEARGSGEATATLRVSVADGTEGGSTVVRFTGELDATGRLTEFDEETLATTGRRLLDRFAAALASPDGAAEPDAETEPEADAETVAEPEADAETVAEAETNVEAVAGPDGDAATGGATGSEAAPEAAEAEEAEEAEETEVEEAADAAAPDDDTEETGGEETDAEEAEESTATVLYLEDHQSSPGEDVDDDLSDLIAFSDADAERFGLPTGGHDDEGEDEDGDRAEPAEDDRPAAEAAPEPATGLPAELPFEYEQEPVLSGPVRRSIVGRSAEEVDHAPPRGRYAPALPARSARARAASRWGGEAGGIVVPGPGGRSAMPWVIGGGVALLGGAVVLARALRRR